MSPSIPNNRKFLTVTLLGLAAFGLWSALLSPKLPPHPGQSKLASKAFSTPFLTTKALSAPHVSAIPKLPGTPSAGNELIESRQTSVNEFGQFERVQLWKTGLKYSFLRVEQSLVLDENGKEVLLDTREMAADHFIIRLKPGSSISDLERFNNLHNAKIIKRGSSPDTFLIQIAQANLDALPAAIATYNAELANVSYVEPDYAVRATAQSPNDPEFPKQWSLSNPDATYPVDVHATSAWAIGGVTNKTGTVLIAIIDSGVDLTHPDLGSNLWKNKDEPLSPDGIDNDSNGYIDDYNGWNFYDDNRDVSDVFFHGTHVAGILAAQGNNAIGIAGVAPWKTQVMPLRFMNGTGLGFTSDAIEAFHYAMNKKARIISVSWGSTTFSQALKDVIDTAGNLGITVVAAAGNSGVSLEATNFYPAGLTSSNIVSVAASDKFDRIAPFSNYGTVKVDLAAPGVTIYSTLPTYTTFEMSQRGLPTGYGTQSGTSMAVPHVAGTIAMMLAKAPTMTTKTIINKLRSRSVHSIHFGQKVKFMGRVDAFNSLISTYTNTPADVGISKVLVLDKVTGNKNGVIDSDENLQIKLTLLNAGNISVTNIFSVQMGTTSAATMVNSGSGGAASASVGSLSRRLVSYVFQIKTPVSPVGTVLPFTWTLGPPLNRTLSYSLCIGDPTADGGNFTVSNGDPAGSVRDASDEEDSAEEN